MSDDVKDPTALHRSDSELRSGLDEVRAAPRTAGRLDMIVRRPGIDEREVVVEGELAAQVGLVGDTWNARPSKDMPDLSPNPERQLTVMNSRAAALVAGTEDRWPLCGDQLYVDLDIGVENLPAGSRLLIGEAIIQISEPPHLGCAKFTQRFGLDAMRLVNSDEGKALRLRGANASVVTPGTVRAGDTVTVL